MENEDVKFEKGDNKYFFKMFRYVKPYAFPFFFGKFMHSTQGFVFPFVASMFSASIMYAITSRSVEGVYSSILLLVAMLAGFLVPFAAGIYIGDVAEQRAVRDLKKHLFRTFVRNNLEKASSKHSGESIAAINTDADTACEVYSWPLTAFLLRLINIVFSSVVIFAIDIWMGLAALTVGLIGFAVQYRFSGPLAEINRRWLAVNADSVKSVSNIFPGAMAIRAYNMQEKTAKSYEPVISRLKQLNLREGFISALQGMFSVKTNWLSLAVSFGLGGFFVTTGRLEFHLLMVMPFMSTTLTSGFSGIGGAYAELQGPISGAKRIFKILDEGEAEAKKGGIQKDANGYNLSINNLSFKYIDAENEALKGINLEIAENKMIALVGESGSGKSTLLRAIIGLYERDNLGLTLGDLSFNESSVQNWRRNFAYVDQSCKLFDMTIKENIAMGKKGKANDDEIKAAAVRAAVHDFIETLENGYDAPCGEKGSTLSGGQKQRIAIARALITKAPVMVFDEATSALDAQSERYVMETIHSLRSDHTILITTHNLENITTADQIVVMDNGQVAETGTHEQLMERNGLYSRLYNNERQTS